MIAIALAGTVINVFLRSRVPLSLGLPSGQDAKLFVRQASAIAHGHWLGTFDPVILAKGPAYPAFMATMYRLHISLSIGDQLTWLLAAACVAACVWVATRTLTIAVVVYLLVAFDPSNFNYSHATILRDGWYQGVSLLFASLCFLAVWAAVNGARTVAVIGLSVIAGLTGAAFWLCREEGGWVFPTVAVIFVGLPLITLLRRFRRRRDAAITRGELLRRSRPVALAALTLGLALYAPILAVLQLNKAHYGTALTNDMTTGQFARTYADWSRVIDGPAKRDIPITRAQREAVYRISPAALEMQPTMESAKNPWMAFSCHGRPLTRCDLSGAFTVWSLRRSAAATGHFTSEPAFQSYFAQIARDIEQACGNGALHCRVKLPVMLQPLLQAPRGPLLLTMRVLSSNLFWSKGFYILPASRPRVLRPGDRAGAAGIIRDFPSESGEARRLASLHTHLWPYRLLIAGYRTLLPILVVVAILGMIADLSLRRTRASVLNLLCLALLVGMASRIFVFALVNVTQYPTVHDSRYQLPTHGFLIAFAVIGCVVAMQVLRECLPIPAWASKRGNPQDSESSPAPKQDASQQRRTTAVPDIAGCRRASFSFDTY